MERILHLRFDGRSFDVGIDRLTIGSDFGDRELKAALARAESRFRGREKRG